MYLCVDNLYIFSHYVICFLLKVHLCFRKPMQLAFIFFFSSSSSCWKCNGCVPRYLTVCFNAFFQSEYGVSGLPWMTTGYSRGSSGSGSAEWPPWGTRPSSNSSRRSRACSVLLAAGALVALLVVLAVAALALYMGAFRTDSSDGE